jgi:hypothetical protein
MADYILRPGQPLTLAKDGALEIDAAGADLVVDAGDQQARVRQARPSQAIIPASVDHFTADVVPPGSQSVFRAGSSVALVLSAWSGDERNLARVDQVDLTGLGRRPALRAVTNGSQWQFACLLEGVMPGQGIAGHAQARARSVLAGRLDGPVPRIAVVVDGSASMRRAVAPGSLEAVVDTVWGVAHEVGGQQPLVFVWSGRLKSFRGADAGAQVGRHLEESDPVVGLDLDPAAVAAAVGDPSSPIRVYFVTDAPPSFDPAGAGDVVWHPVVVGPGDGRPARGAGTTWALEREPGALRQSLERGGSDTMADLVASLIGGAAPGQGG